MSIVASKPEKLKPYGFYLPEALDLGFLDPKLRPYAAYFVTMVIFQRVLWHQDHKGYVSLKAEYLHRVIPWRRFPKVKQALLDHGVIEADNHYVKGVKAIGYRLGPEYKDRAVVRHDCPCPKLSRKVHTIKKAEDRRSRLPVYQYLLHQFDRLNVDVGEAERILATLPHQNINRTAVTALAAKDLYFTVCPHSRVHTNVTNLDKRLRGCLHVGGEKLVNIDIRNSQPLFLALLILNSKNDRHTFRAYRSKKPKAGKPHSTTTNFHENTHTLPLPATTIPTLVEVVTGYEVRDISTSEAIRRSRLSQDELEYLELCEAGELYDHLMAVMGRHDRNAFKEDFYRGVFFGPNHTRSEVKDCFKELFPQVAKFVREEKRKEYRQLAWKMQNDEGRFMINTVCERLRTELPQAPIFTIHDSILTTLRYADLVTNIIRQEFAWLGISPALRIEGH